MSYGYDAASRLISINYDEGTTHLGDLAYQYDAAGRRRKMSGSYARANFLAAVTSASYDAANELTQWGAATLSYDADGNLANDGTNLYAWNARNQLASMGAATFAYDGFSRRTLNGAGTSFLYDGVNPVQELSGATPTANLLTGGVDQIFTRTDSAGTRNFLSDALGSTLALTDSSGVVQTEYTYEPFGATTASGASSGNLYQFTGRENDGTGLYYNRARYYDPAIGRFISEDPAFPAGGINGCAYASNNPLFSTDPFGLSPTPITPWDRFRLLGAGALNLGAAQEKVLAAAACGAIAPADGGITLPEAIYEASTAGTTGVTGLMQIFAAATGNRNFSQAADAVSVFTSISGPITLVATGGNIEKASTASTIEAVVTFGLSGSYTPVGVGNTINLAFELAYPIKK